MAGIEVYDILRDEYDIQIEFGDIGNVLAYLSIGDRTGRRWSGWSVLCLRSNGDIRRIRPACFLRNISILMW